MSTKIFRTTSIATPILARNPSGCQVQCASGAYPGDDGGKFQQGPGGAGHGPNYRLTRKVQGKTVTETFASPSALKKAQREVAEFHQFQDLCEQVVEVSEQLCAARLCSGRSLGLVALA